MKNKNVICTEIRLFTEHVMLRYLLEVIFWQKNSRMDKCIKKIYDIFTNKWIAIKEFIFKQKIKCKNKNENKYKIMKKK